MSKDKISHSDLIAFSLKIYEKGYSGLDLIEYVEKNEIKNITEIKKYELLFTFNKIRKEFRNEKILILYYCDSFELPYLLSKSTINANPVILGGLFPNGKYMGMWLPMLNH